MPGMTTSELTDVPWHREFEAWIHPAPRGSIDRRDSQVAFYALRRVDLLLAAGLFILALVVRGPLILRGESLLHSDEAIVGLMAQDIAEGRRFPIYFYGQRYMGALEAYVIAAILPCFDDPIRALRFGPAIFFGALVAVQFLMLTRWFGRRGGWIGALVLLATPPMFAQWSVSARGGYIEILLLGTLLLWAYTEWFDRCDMRHAKGGFVERASTRRFLFGLILGLGLWINPSIALFVLPIVAHYALQRLPAGREPIRRLGLLTLPMCLLAGVLLLNAIWSVHVDHGRVHSHLLLGLLPRHVAGLLIGVLAAAMVIFGQRRFNLLAQVRRVLPAAGPMIAGILIGAAPAVFYVLQVAAGLRAMESALPLGLRPLWTVGETMSYLWHGLPLLFGADARPFLHLVTIGRPSPLIPLNDAFGAIVLAANGLVLCASVTAALIFVIACRSEIGRLLRLRTARYSPALLLLIGATGTVLLFLLSGASHDFNTIRYLIPIWAFLPGLLAAACTQPPFQRIARAGVIALCFSWTAGQIAMVSQLGRPHPLRHLSDELVARNIDPAVAEIFDAHLLSYLTRQQCRVAEFEPFWSRLSHYQAELTNAPSVNYIVRTSADRDTEAIHAWRYPGPPPPEVHRRMWRKLHARIESDRSALLSHQSLVDDYDLVHLRRSPVIP